MPNQRLLDSVAQLVRRTGYYQLSRFRQFSPDSGAQKSPGEFVTEVDLESERRLVEGLERLLPEAGFFGEETGERGSERLRWVIDPLDGTSNFLSGLDQFSISVALEIDGRVQIGVVYRPASDEIFTALQGYGVHRNGALLQPSTDLQLQDAMIGTGFPFRSIDLQDAFFSCAREVLGAARDIRRFGSAALDLCYLAAGYFQGFWESDLQPYDVAAGLLFLQESGIEASNQSGAPFSPYSDRLLVAGFPQVHFKLLPIIARHYPSSLPLNSSQK